MGATLGRGILTLSYFLLFSIPAIWLTHFVDKVGKTFAIETYFVKSESNVRHLHEAKEM